MSDMSHGVRHPIFARVFPVLSRAMEASPDMAGLRAALLAPLTGEVIEIGAGTGVNFGHYPATVARVLAVEPEPGLRRLAASAAGAAAIPVTVTDGVADALPADSASFDAAVVSLVLCSVPDQDAALAEIRRGLRPGGQLCFFEHVRADSSAPGAARTQRVLDATVWPHLAGGCHLSRDTAAAIERAGFTITKLDRLAFAHAPKPMSFHISGYATAPG